MRNSLILLILFCIVADANAQVGFDPAGGGFTPSAIGTKITLHTTLVQPTKGEPTSYVHLLCDPGVTAAPADFEECPGCSPVAITITFDTDKAGCYGPLAVSATYDTGGQTVTFDRYFFGGYIYDPNLVGRVQLQHDTINFGNVPIGTDDSLYLGIWIDTFGSVFRKLLPLNINQPFTSMDSVTPGIWECETAQITSFFVQP